LWAFGKDLKNFVKTERDREIDDDENVKWRNVDANSLLDIKYKYLNIYCTLP